MASVFLLFMILFSFIVSCGTVIKEFKRKKSVPRRINRSCDYEEDL